MTVSTRSELPPAVRLTAMLGAWAIASFVLTRSPSLQAAVFLPFAEWQARLAGWILGTGALPVAMAPGCSGLDVMALCAGTIAMYPAAPRHRAIGAAGGLTLLLVANIVRIAMLARTATLPGFPLLHEYVWPAVLTLVALGYTGVWIWRVDRPLRPASPRSVRFVACGGALLVAYVTLVALFAAAGALDGYAAAVAAAAASFLQRAGVDAAIQGRVLRVHDVSYLITYECVTTPLLPIYLAAVVTAPWRGRTRAIAAALAIPFFTALSVVRLASLAIPPVLFGSRIFLTHAFNQLLAAALLVGLAAMTTADAASDWRGAARRVLAALVVATGVGVVAGPFYTRLLAAGFPAAFHDAADLQGALLVLPALQLALLAAFGYILWPRVAAMPSLAAVALLICTQAIVLAAAPALRPLIPADLLALVWRGWALAVPAALAIALSGALPLSPAGSRGGARPARVHRSTRTVEPPAR